jgi:hypothetical protein
VVRSDRTCARLALIVAASPLLTPLWVSLRIEARRAAASWHTTEVAVGDAEDAEGVPDGLVLLAVVPLEPQATASSPAPSATAAADHQAGLVPVIGLVSMPSHRPPGSYSRPAVRWGITRNGRYRGAHQEHCFAGAAARETIPRGDLSAG